MLDALLKYVPATHGKGYIGMMQRLPYFAQTVCVIGESGAVLGYLLKKRTGTRAFGIVQNAECLAPTRKMLDGVELPSTVDGNIPLESLDAVILCNVEESLESGMVTLAQVANRLSPTCYVVALFGDPNCAQSGATSGLAGLEVAVEEALSRVGYRLHRSLALEDESIGKPGNGIARMLIATPVGYEALEHARALLANDQPAYAFEVIEQIPCGPSETPDRQIQIHWERLQTVSAWLRLEPAGEQDKRVMAAQESFYCISYALPRDPAAYLVMADCWRLVGDYTMAARLLRSIQHQTPRVEIQQQLNDLPEGGVSTARVENIPRWRGESPYRVLFLMHPRPHYGIDVLYDGLCTTLGDENVVDYPYKPWLHGQESEEFNHYPCRFDHRGSRYGIEDILAMLDADQFDLILYADVEGTLPRDEMVAIIHRAGKCPVAIVDALDEFSNFRERVAQHLKFDGACAYFKREKHRTLDYGPNSFPLPFAYDRRKALEVFTGDRPRPFFWAGHRMFGTRRLYLEALEQQTGWDLASTYSPEEYVQRIRESLVGLNCFGMGFDTVRYWELPANGSMLLSEQLPIEIPFDFSDGKQAVFFEGLPSMLEKVEYFQAHPEEALEIAAAGHAHYLLHHTNEARAQQLLGWVGALSVVRRSAAGP